MTIFAGLFLAILVAPSVWGYSAIGGKMYEISLVGIFVLVVVGLIVWAVKPEPKKNLHATVGKSNGFIARFFANLAVLSAVAALYVTETSGGIPADMSERYVLQNVGTGLVFATAVFCVIVHIAQTCIYWPFWDKNDKKLADERQLQVRNRVYEKSYRYLMVAILAALFFIDLSHDRVRDVSLWLLIIGMVGMPAIVASRQKDS